MIDSQPTAAELRVMRGDAARVRGQRSATTAERPADDHEHCPICVMAAAS